MTRRKVTIVSGFQIIDNPRVVKEADALVEIGCAVEVLGAIHSPAAVDRIEALLKGRSWTHTPVIDRTGHDAIARLRGALSRAGSRFWREAGRRLNIAHHRQLGVATEELCRAALASRADLYSLHLEAALWTGKVLADRGLPFRMDIEDWYSEDGLPADRALRPIKLMKRLEHRLLNGAVHATTTSEAMASALAAEYGCRPPDIVYNSFPTEDRQAVDGLRLDRKSQATPSVIWFSQTIGPGRGLETLIDAVERLEPELEVHLRGTPRAGFIESLLGGRPEGLKRRVHVHAQVPQAELLSRLMEHDIGYCGELSDCRSRDLTITNKALEYMRAGLAVVASDTTGQKEVAAKAPDIVSLFRQGDPRALATALRPLITEPDRLRAVKRRSLQDFDSLFGWNICKRIIQAQVLRYFEGSGEALPRRGDGKCSARMHVTGPARNK